MKSIYLLILLLHFVWGYLFYYNTTLESLRIISNSSKGNLSKELFVFFPGTSAKCEEYTNLFYTILGGINVLCINYKSSLFFSNKFYKHNSFIDRGLNLEKKLLNALKTIKNVTELSYLTIDGVKPNWKNIRVSGHSQGGVIATVWGKYYNLSRLILFSSPGCQFGKRLHDWIGKPFVTPTDKIYGIQSLQDTILPWNYGNKLFSCEKTDGIYSYIKNLGFTEDQIQLINPEKSLRIRYNTRIFVLDIPFIDGCTGHLITSFNTCLYPDFMSFLWYKLVLNK